MGIKVGGKEGKLRPHVGYGEPSRRIEQPTVQRHNAEASADGRKPWQLFRLGLDAVCPGVICRNGGENRLIETGTVEVALDAPHHAAPLIVAADLHAAGVRGHIGRMRGLPLCYLRWSQDGRIRARRGVIVSIERPNEASVKAAIATTPSERGLVYRRRRDRHVGCHRGRCNERCKRSVRKKQFLHDSPQPQFARRPARQLSRQTNEKIHTVLRRKKYPKNNRFTVVGGLCLRSKQSMSTTITTAALAGGYSLVKNPGNRGSHAPRGSEFLVSLPSLASTTKNLPKTSVTIELHYFEFELHSSPAVTVSH